MYYNFTFSILAISLFLVKHCESVSFITKCKSDDPACIKKSAQAVIPIFAEGLPDYNIPTIDPHLIKYVDASSKNLKLIVSDVVMVGLKNTIAKEIRRDKANEKIFMKILCNVQLDGKYEMDGNLLFLPIRGKGDVHATIRKMQVNIELDLKEFPKDEVTYWRVEQKTFSYILKDKSTVVFENLFEDNKILGDAAREVIKNNGNEIVLEVGDPIVKDVVDTVVSEINKLFDNVPASELSID